MNLVVQGVALSILLLGSQTAKAQDTYSNEEKRNLPFQQFIDFAAAKVTALPVSDHIYALTEPMQRIGGIVAAYVGQDAVLLVDSGYPKAIPRIKETLATLTKKPIRIIINSHWHVDHTDGNSVWAEDGALIVAHEGVRLRRQSEQEILAFGETYAPLDDIGLPSLTYSDRMTLRWPEQTIVLHHVNAHTDGDTLVQFVEDNVIHIGDLSYGRQYPFLDLGTGGGWQGFVAGLSLALSLADENTKFIPGHLLPQDKRSPVLSTADIRAFHSMAVEIEHRVRSAISQGRTLKEIIKANLISDMEADWYRTSTVSSAAVLSMAYLSLIGQ